MINSARLFRASAPLLASPDQHLELLSTQGSELALEAGSDPGLKPEPVVTSSPAEVAMAESLPLTGAGSDIDDDMADYARLKRRLIQATLIASAAAVPIAALAFDLSTAGSLLVGALAGLLYLRLLSRSVDKLGNGARSVGKVQLLVPVVLVISSTRIPQLDLLPALIGFLLYKPALLIQGLLDARVGSSQR